MGSRPKAGSPFSHDDLPASQVQSPFAFSFGVDLVAIRQDTQYSNLCGGYAESDRTSCRSVFVAYFPFPPAVGRYEAQTGEVNSGRQKQERQRQGSETKHGKAEAKSGQKKRQATQERLLAEIKAGIDLWALRGRKKTEQFRGPQGVRRISIEASR